MQNFFWYKHTQCSEPHATPEVFSFAPDSLSNSAPCHTHGLAPSCVLIFACWDFEWFWVDGDPFQCFWDKSCHHGWHIQAMHINSVKVESLLKITAWKMEATPFDNFFKHKHFIISGAPKQTRLQIFRSTPHAPPYQPPAFHLNLFTFIGARIIFCAKKPNLVFPFSMFMLFLLQHTSN